VQLPALLARHNPRQNLLVLLCLGGLLGLGLLIWPDYGVSYDVAQSRNIGMTNLHYVLQRLAPSVLQDPVTINTFMPYTTPLAEFNDRDYGVGYELPVTIGEWMLPFTSLREAYFYRHLCTFLISYVGILAVYGLGRRRYGGDWRAGLAAAGLVVLSPRLFGEFFYNDKDAVFMALSAVATYTTVRFVERPAWGWALAHALACALAIDVRLMAVLWPLATLLLLAARAKRGEYAAGPAGRWGAFGLYCLALPALVVALWPYLWEHPWANFGQAFSNMAHFRWDGAMWYRGDYVYSKDLPWHYVPQWILITTPFLQLALLGVGLWAVGRQLVRQRWWFYRAGTREWQDVLFLGLGLGPVLAVVVLHSVLYDGWRQLYFVYPSLMLLALRGLVATWRWLATRPQPQQRLVVALGVLGVLSTAGQMAWMHPLESLYFNRLAGPHGNERYEHDYWGISYRQGIKWVLAHDDRPVLHIRVDDIMSPAYQQNCELLTEDERKRLVQVVKPEEADYFLGNYRWHPQPYPYPNRVHDIRAGRQVALSIFRLTW